MFALAFYPSRPRASAAALLLGLAIIEIGCAPADLQFLAPTMAGRALPSFAPVVQGVMPTVVNVSAIQRASRAAADVTELGPSRAKDRNALRGLAPPVLDEFLRRFFEQQTRKGVPFPSTALGSGFIVDPGGYVVTDDHVVENADKVMITFQDGDRTSGSGHRTRRDDRSGTAQDRYGRDPYLMCDWGDSDAARVGDWVLAIGNPFGLDNTVSSGIISGRGRDIHAGPYDDFLQIDAAINRGNSGGPTFDLNGNVIGINTAIYSPNGGSVGIGFRHTGQPRAADRRAVEGARQGRARLARCPDPAGDTRDRREFRPAERERGPRRRSERRWSCRPSRVGPRRHHSLGQRARHFQDARAAVGRRRGPDRRDRCGDGVAAERCYDVAANYR